MPGSANSVALNPGPSAILNGTPPVSFRLICKGAKISKGGQDEAGLGAEESLEEAPFAMVLGIEGLECITMLPQIALRCVSV
jgi:hypothetical protein